MASFLFTLPHAQWTRQDSTDTNRYLWLDFFEPELIWAVETMNWDAPVKWTQDLEVAPSWSWASIRGARINNAYLRFNNFHQRIIMTQVIKLPDTTPFSYVNYDDHLGILSRYCIALKGRLCQCRAISQSDRYKPLNYLHRHSKSHDSENDGGNLFYDCELREGDHSLLYCLLVARLKHRTNSCGDLVDLGIVLALIDLRKSLFRRVGLYFEASRSREEGQRMFKKYQPHRIVYII